MGTVRLTLWLFILMTLTTTWARSFLEVPKESPTENPARKHWKRNANGNETFMEMTVRHEDSKEEYLKQLVHNYLEKKANESATNDGQIGRKSRSLRENDNTGGKPFSERRLQKMLDKAIFKIITGDLSTADILLLKSLNYDLDEILAIRERELGKKMSVSDVPRAEKSFERTTNLNEEKTDEGLTENGKSSTDSSQGNRVEGNDEKMSNNEENNRSTVSYASRTKKRTNVEKPEEDFDFEAYNRQAVYDYENAANNMSQQSELDPISSVSDHENLFVDNNRDVPATVEDDLHAEFDRAMESHVVFKIRYDDSEFDSRSDEKLKQMSKERGVPEVRKRPHYDFMIPRKSHDRSVESASAKTEFNSSPRISSGAGINATPENRPSNTFHESSADLRSSLPVVYRLGNFVAPTEQTDKTTIEEEKSVETADGNFTEEARNESSESQPEMTIISSPATPGTDTVNDERVQADLLAKNQFSNDLKKISMYEGLEWVEDDVYRVIPEAIDTLDYDNNANYLENETVEDSEGNGTHRIDLDSRIDDEGNNDTINYQNENPDDGTQTEAISTNSSMRYQPNANLSAYQQLALAHRRDRNVTSAFDSQGQKAIEDIKLKVLAMTGRFNLSSTSNQVQRERLTLFSPICQVPRNTDAEAWTDAFSMNMHFHINLTSGDHVVAAKLRIYKLPQSNITIPTSPVAEEIDEEEKKIRISVYFYTKSLKKHRSKKRLMDSVVTALTTEGSHLALDVRQALRFWRQNLRSSHGNSNNHGLVIQVEDQDGRPLKPSQYIEQDSCHSTEPNQDDKAYQRVPALFVQACSRYVRVVNGEAVTYVNCSKSSRNGRH